jgi:signal transduction histidine kinase
LKSPLITIKSYSGSIQRDLIACRYDRVEADLERIGSAADKMAALLDDLLALSRVGRIVNTAEPVAMKELVEEVLRYLAGLLNLKSVKVDVQSELPMVLCDRQRLAEVIQNLVENAVKYMGDQPEPRILFGMRQEYGKNVFFVQDNGVGIDEKYHQNIFGLFNKLNAKSEGTGIGLALVKRIIEVHGGEVWVESEGAGKGSTFCFTI